MPCASSTCSMRDAKRLGSRAAAAGAVIRGVSTAHLQTCSYPRNALGDGWNTL